MKIYCCGCEKDIEARLTDGKEIYPSRTDLHNLPFWKCDKCGNYVGCHNKTKEKTKPLGCIPTYEIRKLRKEIHKRLDPLWGINKDTRLYLYRELSKHIGREYHTADIRSAEEARNVFLKINRLAENIEKYNRDKQNDKQKNRRNIKTTY